MGCTVEELLSRMSSRELTEWAVFEREHGPLGPARGDWQAALVAHTVAASMGGAEKRPLSSFLLNWSARRKQSGSEQLQIFKALASGGTGVNNRESSHQVGR